MTIKVPLSITLKVVKGAFRQAAPDVLKVALLEMLDLTDVDKAKAWVRQGKTLWHQLDGGLRKHILKAGCMLLAMDLSWLDYDWVVNAIREKDPELASYFTFDEQGRDWLKQQIDYIKWQFAKYPCPYKGGRNASDR